MRGRAEHRVSVGRKWAIAGVVAATMGLLLLLALPSRGRTFAHAFGVPFGVTDPQFVRSVSALAGPPLVPGNSVEPLENGDEAFPAMLAAIRSARQSITFESSYFRKGEMTRAFAAALAERSRAGVRVHAVFDWAGTEKLGRRDIEEMRAAGAEVEIYHHPRLWKPQRAAERSHRRVLVVDGRIGFTGGICVADEWMGHAQDRHHWRDIQFRLEGPVVAQLQAAFMDNWRELRGTPLQGDRYFPALAPAGTLPAQIVTSSPDVASGDVELVYLMSIGAARSSILIENPYFVPDAATRDALLDARKRGVAVSIIVPADSVTDAHTTQWVSRSRWGQLLEAGVRIYRYRTTLLHQKVMIVDSAWVTAGSANFDYRSFRLNDEVNVDVPDATFARRMAAVFLADRANADEMTLAQWRSRGWRARLAERLASAIRFQF